MAQTPAPRAYLVTTFLLSFLVGMVLARYLWLDTLEQTRAAGFVEAILGRQPISWGLLPQSSWLQKMVGAGVGSGVIAVVVQLLARMRM